MKLTSRKRKHQAKKDGPPAYIAVSDTLQCRFLDNAWHLVTLKPLSGPHLFGRLRAADILLRRPVVEITAEQARQRYGAEVYAVHSRRLARRELSQYPIPVKWWG